MHLTLISYLSLLASSTIAIPIPQGAGVGDACNSILTDGDTGSGLVVKEAGTNVASLLKSAGLKRQGAGVGAGCDSILTDADTASGLAVKEAGQNLASLLKSAGGKRQLDKAGAGVTAIVGVVSPNAATYIQGLADTVDGDTTSDSALIGQQLGALEVQAGTGAGNLIPSALPKGAKRQLDKAGAGVAAVVGVVNPNVASYFQGLGDTVDGDGTSDSALVGQQVGALEVQAGTGAGNLVPASIPKGS
ncbi:hypothetical protein GLAREA_03332 [Glarea lozoyensis ATCC 20868]|uniref:Uncharacterized protein n=1 Tax=Glarea lozoyensis (strain ATCC 20868 / MF5171) TaxID=1116229 RepID=S3CXQ0_GLAL2|nr:uncharacterized protein GLAREA_03332 [Glarea lozoyensis ATCC 20868]EPE30365.1 hypothetical protein GLAREA_03332 [Glarea lozoyensis ATCC 20868]